MAQHRLASTALAAFASLSTGCAIVHSTDPQQASSLEGIPYMLPKALLQVDLIEADSVMMLRVQPPTLVGDPSQRYLLSHSANAFASNDLKIQVDPATGLLKSLTSDTTDETLSVLKEAAAALGGRAHMESASAETEAVLFSGFYDPDGETHPAIASRNIAMTNALQATLMRRVAQWSDNCGKPGEDAPRCATAKRIQSLADGQLITIKAEPLGSPAAATTPAVQAPSHLPLAAADCRRGICHRAAQPFLVRLSIKGQFEQSTVVQLPNGGAPVVLPIERVAFTTTHHDVGIKDGVVERYEVKHGSSALAVAKAPVDIYEAILKATSQLIQLRIGANSDQVKLAQSQLDRDRDLKRIADEMEKIGQRAESAPLGGNGPLVTGPRRGDSLLVAEFGVRQVTRGNATGASKADALLPDKQGGTGDAGGNTAKPGQPNNGAPSH